MESFLKNHWLQVFFLIWNFFYLYRSINYLQRKEDKIQRALSWIMLICSVMGALCGLLFFFDQSANISIITPGTE